jgi:hypothetical protein
MSRPSPHDDSRLHHDETSEEAVNEFMFHSPTAKGDLDERHQRIRADVALARGPRRHDAGLRPRGSGIAAVFAHVRAQPRHRHA